MTLPKKPPHRLVYLLDTNIITAHFKGEEAVMQRLLTLPPQNLWVCAVNVAEVVRGCMDTLNREHDNSKNGRRNSVVSAHTDLVEVVYRFGLLQILPYDERAEAVFQSLPREARTAGANDCRIAAVALVFGLTVVTRNVRDFRKVPGVMIDDWNLASS